MLVSSANLQKNRQAQQHLEVEAMGSAAFEINTADTFTRTGGKRALGRWSYIHRVYIENSNREDTTFQDFPDW